MVLAHINTEQVISIGNIGNIGNRHTIHILSGRYCTHIYVCDRYFCYAFYSHFLYPFIHSKILDNVNYINNPKSHYINLLC